MAVIIGAHTRHKAADITLLGTGKLPISRRKISFRRIRIALALMNKQGNPIKLNADLAFLVVVAFITERLTALFSVDFEGF